MLNTHITLVKLALCRVVGSYCLEIIFYCFICFTKYGYSIPKVLISYGVFRSLKPPIATDSPYISLFRQLKMRESNTLILLADAK